MPMTIRIEAEINRATTSNYYDYFDHRLSPWRVKDDLIPALETALEAIQDGATSLTTPIRHDGDKVGTLTVTEE